MNHLAPLLLAHLLLPLLRPGAPARIVNVASVAQAPLDFADLMLERGYDGFRARTAGANWRWGWPPLTRLSVRSE